MLKSVVQHEHIRPVLQLDASPLRVAISADSKKNPITEPALQNFYFVAGPARSFVSAAQNGNAFSSRHQFLCEPDHHRRFARSSHGQIPYADHSRAEMLRFVDTFSIQQRRQTCSYTINSRQWPQHQSNWQRKIHSLGVRTAACSWATKLRIASTARSVAPRLSSTSLRAVSPIFLFRSGFRNNSIHDTPASSGLPTWSAAPAATNRSAISAKFSMDSPNTGTFPNAAGSRILCPPDSTSDPPTNTPSANW